MKGTAGEGQDPCVGLAGGLHVCACVAGHR